MKKRTRRFEAVPLAEVIGRMGRETGDTGKKQAEEEQPETVPNQQPKANPLPRCKSAKGSK